MTNYGVWQPIETAPRDGGSLLVLERGVAIQAHWGGDFHPTWVHDRSLGFADFASHWMPLPELPHDER